MIKKCMALMLIFLMGILSLTACGEEETNPTEPSSTVGDVTTVTPEMYSKYLDANGYIENVRALDIFPAPSVADLELKGEDVNPDDETVQKSIDYLLSLCKEEVPGGTIQAGDTCDIGYVGKVDGVAFQGGSTESTEVTAGGNEYIDDFLTKIIGHTVGETFDIECTFPENYDNEQLKGKLAVFTVTVNAIKRTPVLTDAWVAEHVDTIEKYTGFADIQTVDALWTAFFDYYRNQNVESAIYEYLSKLSDAEVPEAAYNYEYNYMDCRFRASYGVTLADGAAQSGYTEESLRALLESDARTELLLQAYCEENHIQAAIADLKEMTGLDDNSAYVEKFGEPYCLHLVLLNRAIRALRAAVVIVD